MCLYLAIGHIFRYFLRKLKKVKKSNGQVLAINEVHAVNTQSPCLAAYYVFSIPLVDCVLHVIPVDGA